MVKFKVTITYEVETTCPHTEDEILATVRLRYSDLGYGSNQFWRVTTGSERAKVRRKW